MDSITFCSNCNKEQKEDFKFCSNCGHRNNQQVKLEVKKDSEYRKNIRLLALYTFLSLTLLAYNSFSDDSLNVLIIFTMVFAIVDIVFAGIQMDTLGSLNFSGLRIAPSTTIILITTATAFTVHYLVDQLNITLWGETVEIMYLFEDKEHALWYALVLVAVFPAIFEELAFRGFVFNNLYAIGGKHSAIYGSAFLFGLVHFSLLSIFWLIPFGILLAYFRNKYNSLLYGIVGHFTHNATTILIEYYNLL